MRVYNFNGGPAALPLEALEQAAAEFLDWGGSGMSVIENSHRAKEVVKLFEEVAARYKRLLALDDDWEVLFLQGGATLQFAMVPMNFAASGGACDYINTGLWSTKAYKEAKICGSTPRLAATGEEGNFTQIPKSFDFDAKANFVHLTSNNTVRGTQWASFPTNAPAPLVADMSSDFMSRPLDLTKFGLVYAGAQKNIGPAGLVMVLVRKSFLEKASCAPNTPTLLSYKTYSENESMYNTPPVFAVYIAGLVAKWLEEQVGGLAAVEKINQAKGQVIYGAIDGSDGFYTGTAAPDSRSLMNVTFKLSSEELDKAFSVKATAEGFVGLNGHRSVGGLRASIYNAVPLKAVEALVDFMKEFKRTRG